MGFTVTLDLDKQFAGGPYHWSRSNGDWRIGFGPSNFLLAQGAGWSVDLGMELFKALKATEASNG
jgi:hypothetical protein